MDKPQSVDLASSMQPQPGQLARVFAAAGDVELSAKFAIICVFFAWFCVDTLVVSLGSVKHGIRFFDAGAIIANPTRMFFSIDTTFGVLLFGALCIACLLLPLAPHLWRNRLAWLAYLAPLVLILVCGLLLYSKTSGEIVAVPSDASGLKGSVMSLANKLLQRGSDYVSNHVAVAAGGYVSLIASTFLAYMGIHRLLRKRN
jgi:hypothetical protein